MIYGLYIRAYYIMQFLQRAQPSLQTFQIGFQDTLNGSLILRRCLIKRGDQLVSGKTDGKSEP